MIKIAVFDNDESTPGYLADKIQEYCAFDCDIRKYENEETLLRESRKQIFDVLFLNAHMNGIDLAGGIRKDNPFVKIILIGDTEKYARSGYKHGVFRFLIKSSLCEELPEALGALTEYFESLNECIVFKTSHSEITRFIDKIQYIEVRDHKITVKSEDILENFHGTLNEYEKKLAPKGFIRIHKSFLVNFRYIFSVENFNVRLMDGKLLPISRNRVSETKNKIQLFKRNETKRPVHKV